MPTTMDPTAQKKEAQEEIPRSSVHHRIEKIEGQASLRNWFAHDFDSAGMIRFVPKYTGKLGRFKGNFVSHRSPDT
jgi:hypothetical protein